MIISARWIIRQMGRRFTSSLKFFSECVKAFTRSLLRSSARGIVGAAVVEWIRSFISGNSLRGNAKGLRAELSVSRGKRGGPLVGALQGVWTLICHMFKNFCF